MSRMSDNFPIRLQQDLGSAIQKFRKDNKLKAVAIAKNSGCSRNILHRLERGEDVTVSSLMVILSAMGLVIRLEKKGLPTLEEMQARFANMEDGE